MCGSQVDPKATSCPNCGQSNINVGSPCPRKPDDVGKQTNPYSTNIKVVVPKGVPIAASVDTQFNKVAIGNPMGPMGGGMSQQKPLPPLPKKKKKPKDRADKDEDVVSDFHKSEEFSQCVDPLEKKKKKNDYINKILQINKSCTDLAIDG